MYGKHSSPFGVNSQETAVIYVTHFFRPSPFTNNLLSYTLPTLTCDQLHFASSCVSS